MSDKIKADFTFPNKKALKDFLSWLSENEQSLWEWGADGYDLNRQIHYDFQNLTFELGEKLLE
ncbi:hypothetical protein VmeM32_00130 [Vibrio phage vB_VmeM-32]|nr:hypothetical protein VmeM32_00130 [Vibrio phage vB_VmeM-32]